MIYADGMVGRQGECAQNDTAQIIYGKLRV